MTGGGQISGDPVFSATGDLLSAPALIPSLADPKSQASFGFIVQGGAPKSLSGNLDYKDQAAGVRIKEISYSSLAISNGTCGPNTHHAKFMGTAAVTSSTGTTYKGVHMAWNPTSPTTPTFESYTPGPNSSGGVDGRFVTSGSQKPAEASSGYAPPFNKVVIVVKASDLGLAPGDTISGFVSGVSQSTDPGAIVGAGATALYDQMPDSLAFTGSYTVNDNQFCRPNNAPTAVLTATPTSGNAPLTVNFNGSGSFDPDTAPPADTIASYTFDFGDGSAAVTQSTPTISHTYNAAGNYGATLSVTDSRGAVSTNTAQVVITVTAPPPGADLAVLKTGPATGHVGQPITYVITVTNNGPQTANGVTVTDTLPKNTGFGSAASTQGSCAPTPHQQVVVCNVGAMANSAKVTVNLMIKPTTKGNFTDTATVSATSPNDPVSGNNTSSVTTKVTP